MLSEVVTESVSRVITTGTQRQMQMQGSRVHSKIRDMYSYLIYCEGFTPV
jgi:hypothetical protein